MTKFRTACLQLCSGVSPEVNLEIVTALVRRAREDGAELVITPENTNYMALDPKAVTQKAVAEEDDAFLRALTLLAAELKLWLIVGGMSVRVSRDKAANRSFVIGPDGVIRARYDKIHMFDVKLPGGEEYFESKSYRPGRNAVITDLPWGTVGLSICYDLRFPALYRLMARAGAVFLTVPSSFTLTTGQMHWHVLLRARAIENGAFVLAPAQSGHHECGRETYGHSLIVDPLGQVLADGAEGVGFIISEIDTDMAGKTRASLPVLENDKPVGLSQ